MIAAAPQLTALQRLRKLTADAWRPRARVSPDEWIEKHIILNEEHEASRGPYDLTNRPWWRAVLRAAGNTTTRHIRLRSSTQVGKTLALCSLICFLAENSPASAMAVLPDRDSATEFRDRLYALAESSGLQVPPAWRWNTRHCDIGDMRVYLAWPRSRQRLRGRRCKYVFRSEIDVWSEIKHVGNPIEASNRRVKAFSRYLILDESTPIPDVSRIEVLERDTNQLRWWAKCPQCGEFQVIRFFPIKDGPLAGKCGILGIRDAHGNLKPVEQIRSEAYYACQAGCKITNDQKRAFVATGMAVPRGQTIDHEGSLIGTPERGERDVGIHLWAVHSNDNWGEIGAEYALALANGTLPDFYQNVLGLSHKQHSAMPTWRELGTRLAGPNARGQVPPGAWFLTAGGDVQDRECYVSVRAWGDHRTSWLVDWFVFEREAGDDGELVKSDLKQINTVLERAYQVCGPNGETAYNPRGRSQLKIVRLGIDANHRTLDVHNWIKSLGEAPRVIAVRGEAGVKAADKYKETVVLESKRVVGDTNKHVEYEGGLALLNINPDVFRSDLADRFVADPSKPGAWFVTSDCLSTGEFYLKQVVNEPKVVIRGKDGRPKVEYRERDGTIGHDFWDAEVYSSAVAQKIVDDFDGQPGWDASKWPRPNQRVEKPSAATESRTQRDFS